MNEEIRQQQITPEQLAANLRGRHMNMLGQLRNQVNALGPLLENVAVELTLDKEQLEAENAALTQTIAKMQKELDDLRAKNKPLSEPKAEP